VRLTVDGATLETTSRPRLRQLFRWWTIALLVVSLLVLIPVYWTVLHAPAVGMFHDDGVYLVTAKALATGHGYRIISLPDEIPQTKYPILFPFVLSLVWRLAPDFPANTLVLKAVPVSFALLWFWLAFQLIAREASRAVAGICVAITAMGLWTVYLGTALLSETMFASLCTGFLILLRREEIDDGKRWHWMAAAAVAGLACLTRTAGVCAIATGFIYFAARRRLGRASAFLAISLAICGPWFLWVSAQHLPATDAYYSSANYGSWNVLSHYFPMDRKVGIVLLNALYVLRTPLSLTGLEVNGWTQLGTGILASALWAVYVKRRTVLDLFLGVYVAMTLAWAWPPERFIQVVYPLIALWCWRTWQAATGRFPRWVPAMNLTGMVLISLLIGQTLWLGVADAAATQRTGVALGQQDPWWETSKQLDWIRKNTPANAIVLANLDPLFYLYTGRKAVRGFLANPYWLFYNTADPARQPIGTVEDLREMVRRERVNYIVRAANRTFSEGPYLDKLILELIRREPGGFRLVEQNTDPRFQIYQVEQPL
jgi:hypothetical protein